VNYDDIYGDDREPAFTLYYDKELMKNFAVGTSIMYYEDEGRGVSATYAQSVTAADFKLAKGELSAVYWMKFNDDQLFVPQFKAGISGTYFNEKIKGGKRTENVYLGYHAGAYIMLLLDRLEPDYAKSMKRSFEIEDSYFFIGADYSNSDDIDEHKLNLSGVEYSVGLMFRY
jgi:hypothetical protein